MTDETISCPQCGNVISLTSTLRAEIEETLRPELAAQISATAKQAAEKQVAADIAMLKEELAEADKSLRKSKDTQLELAKEKRRLVKEKEDLALEVETKLAAERAAVRSELATQISEEFKQKDLQKDKQIADMLRQVEEMKRKGEQGSQQLQGEVGELALEEVLRSAFPRDVIEPVPTGMRGADLIQRIHDSQGRECGIIVWERKQTKAWSDTWLQKLRDDTRSIKGDIAILLTAAMPAGETEFCARENVWVAHPRLAVCLATLVRAGIENVVKANVAATGRLEKADLVYGFVTSTAFRGQVEMLVEVWSAMKGDLDAEKRAITKAWAKRERQLEKALMGTAQLYGSVQGIVGSSLPEIEALSLDAIGDDRLLEEGDHA